MKKILFLILTLFFICTSVFSIDQFEKDTIKTAQGDIEITFIGHGTLMFKFNNKIIHIDPVMSEADYYFQPKADIILVTHHHGDHLDAKALDNILTQKTEIILTDICHQIYKRGTVMKNGDILTIQNIKIEAVPAYNIVHKRSSGAPFHIKGEGNSYILTLGEKRIYIGGDTENTPEMKALKNIDIAFLPMNLPFTMTPEMVADAAKTFKPKILYPYHFGNTDTSKIIELLKDEKVIEVRIRRMK